MATIALTNAGVVEVVEPGEQEIGIAAAAIVGGTLVQRDSSGNWIQALADTAPHALGARLALRSVAAKEPLTAARTGKYAGFTLSQAFNVNIYISDTGTLADAAGTVTVIAGRVINANANDAGAAHDKILELDLPL